MLWEVFKFIRNDRVWFAQWQKLVVLLNFPATKQIVVTQNLHIIYRDDCCNKSVGQGDYQPSKRAGTAQHIVT